MAVPGLALGSVSVLVAAGAGLQHLAVAMAVAAAVRVRVARLAGGVVGTAVEHQRGDEEQERERGQEAQGLGAKARGGKPHAPQVGAHQQHQARDGG